MFHDEFDDARLRKEVVKRAVKEKGSLLQQTTARFKESEKYHKLGVHHFACHAWQDYCESAYKLKMTESTMGRGPFKDCRGHGKS